jgi:Family of unknown function (DUF5360)
MPMNSPSTSLRSLLLITDIGFIAYWLITAAHVLPQSLLFKDYDNPILVAWNWSFLPLDFVASGTGLTALVLAKRHNPAWRPTALASLVFTLCAGLMALAFWTLRSDFDATWWLPNLFLLIWPLWFVKSLAIR